MNLNMQLRNKLIRDVLLSQMNDEFKNLDLEMLNHVTAKAKSIDDGIYAKVKSAFIEAGVEDFRSFISTTSYVSIDGLRENLYVKARGDRKDESQFLFMFNRNFKTKTVFFHSRYESVLIKSNAAITKTDERQKHFIDRAKALHDDLFAVIYSVKTIKALQDNTSIFNEFLPSLATGGQLIPVESLLRINELTPKKDKAA